MKVFITLKGFALWALTLPLLCNPVLAADSANTPLLVVSHCMKSTVANYVDIEKELWLPLHQEMVNQGYKNSWAVYWVKYGNRDQCDFFVIETYLGEEQYLNSDKNLGKAYQAVYGEKDIELFTKTQATRDMVESSLWHMKDSVGMRDHTMLNINWMNAPDTEQYLKVERELWKPMHKHMVDNGLSKGWGVYQLLFPRGNSIGYNFVAVDFVDNLKYVDLGTVVKKVHSGKSLPEIGELTEQTRSNVLTQTWTKVVSTVPPKK